MNRRSRFALGVLAVGALAGCSTVTGADSGSIPAPGGGAADVPCIVGTWQLDVPHYGQQSEAFMVGLGIPIQGYSMSGEGTIQFTADGLVTSAVSLTQSGMYVLPDRSVPFNVPASSTSTGNWSLGDEPDVIDLSNWTTTTVVDPTVPVDPSVPSAPALDYSNLPSVNAECSADSLLIQGPDAPLAALWHR